jgi:hypothetical protein
MAVTGLPEADANGELLQRRCDLADRLLELMNTRLSQATPTQGTSCPDGAY